ncbi:micrococcal nuclease [Geodermatophilus obscurus]|uniref:Micrococcal nuclease n=1 Tax=Geodermatophilus obscurus TaxID=1861 RepID=A0A1M7TGC5_9ACTN|nr:thermonuclease family protein [Geodermatophilus obscurus]SHN69802.1 micrococcal nuclease [Geodermatophilus obscurus]
MKELFAAAGAHKAATAVVVAGVIAGGGVVHAATDNSTTATVAKVVDGDTIDVRYDGETYRVRLLNVDTPESVDPEKPVECLGSEASEWLKQRLPAGTEVSLERDQDTLDDYGRELAAVFVGDNLISAEIARAGLGVAMSVGANTKYLRPVQTAQAEAEAVGRGMYSNEVECTVPAQIEQLQAAATDAIQQAPAPAAALAAFDGQAAELAAVAGTAKALLGVLDGDIDALPLLAHGADRVAFFRSQVTAVQSRLDKATAANSTARAARNRQLEAEARRAAEEAARRAAGEAARKAAEEAAREAAEEAAERAAAAPAAPRSSTSGGSSSRSSGSSSTPRTAAPSRSSGGSDSGPSTYTGCRSYAPGGKTWTPIPC